MFDVQSNMVAGSLHDLTRVHNSILIGSGVAQKLSLHVNLKDYKKAPEVSPEMEMLTGYKAEDWVKANEQLK
eukprot:gene11920-11715_t